MNKTSSIEQYLAENGTLTYRFKGVSMNPLLREGRDLITVVQKSSERCRRYDVVLYRRYPDQLVLHRIVEVRDEDYVILGDNCLSKEYGIRDTEIIGIMTSFTRKGKEIEVTDRKYQMYVSVWTTIHPMYIKLRTLRKNLQKCMDATKKLQ